MKKALIFDCDGVLGDTEQFGHLVAFNRMWKELAVPWEWSVEEYGRKLKIGGGKERMASLFSEPAFLKAWPAAPADQAARHDTVAAWHKRKTEIYKEIIRSGRIPARSGVKRHFRGSSRQRLASWRWLPLPRRKLSSAVLRHVMGEATAALFFAGAGGGCGQGQEAGARHLPDGRPRTQSVAGGLRGGGGLQ
jgi:hypothetical protein